MPDKDNKDNVVTQRQSVPGKANIGALNLKSGTNSVNSATISGSAAAAVGAGNIGVAGVVTSSATNSHSESKIQQIVESIKQWVEFRLQYMDPNNGCFRVAVNKEYQRILKTQAPNWWERTVTIPNFNVNNVHLTAANHVWRERLEWAYVALKDCLVRNNTKKTVDVNSKEAGRASEINTVDLRGPFDRRLDRLIVKGPENLTDIRRPFATRFAESATSGYFMSKQAMEEAKAGDDAIQRITAEHEALKNDNYYIGIPSLMNAYSLTKLYGSEGGNKLVNKRGERRWYEIDQAIGDSNNSMMAYTMNPTTSSLISWGKADPYGRTPYHFTDFAFAKYWNKIENNRLITLRRFAAPILDNMKFPGMDGTSDKGTAGGESGGGTPERGSSSLVVFPPMATAITYLGDETGNSLNSLLKFTTGVNWDKQKGDVWPVGTEETPDAEAGPGKMSLFGGLTSLSKMLNVAGGNFNREAIQNLGNLPPDPYKEGPYENRILGPVNRIDEVAKRKAGLVFEWSGLNITFEYVARPIGGINTKAVILDILSNFLVIGSASAVFFGGQHRFMGKPARYPFLGGKNGIESFYSGDVMGWANATIKQFTDGVTNPGGVNKSFSDFFSNILSNPMEAIKGLFAEGAAGSNIVKAVVAEKSSGQIPYLTGLKALLTGEPVGEWHVTIGNPLNPIAMIGNLICTGVEVEFGEELGPDDFPTEIKFVVKLEHAMGRDRDAIQSIFNRGMGRIYDLPDGFEGSADGQTKIDDYTANANKTGTAALSKGWLAGPSTTGTKSGPPVIKQPSNAGTTSVWSPLAFKAISSNLDMSSFDDTMFRSAYRSVDWVALKSLK